MEIDEFSLIKSISKLFHRLDVSDDAAFIPVGIDSFIVLTIDDFVEDIHYKENWFSPEEIGFKAVSAATSDIPACGAKPEYILTAISVPNTTNEDFILRVYKGIKEFTEKFNIKLIGGNVTKSPYGFRITTTVLGYSSYPVKRSGAKINDLICVTGDLGKSALALDALLNNKSIPDEILKRFLKPVARVETGKLIGEKRLANSMADISDGLISDIIHILEASNVGAEIYLNKLPVSDIVAKYSKENSIDPYLIAAKSGEEYELVFTTSQEKFDYLKYNLQQDISVFGKIVEKDLVIFYNDQIIDKNEMFGFNHFSKR